ncbi:integrase core domain-containing protein [Thiolapillus sp.]|uniref:integrase core domain-containing protein n=1 Tax=Thiolapillus sp. TaxID=2017437 RepID=UPI003AF8CC89
MRTTGKQCGLAATGVYQPSLRSPWLAAKAYDSIVEARTSLDIYFTFYNTERRHQRLDRRTPDNVYYEATAKKVI